MNKKFFAVMALISIFNLGKLYAQDSSQNFLDYDILENGKIMIVPIFKAREGEENREIVDKFLIEGKEDVLRKMPSYIIGKDGKLHKLKIVSYKANSNYSESPTCGSTCGYYPTINSATPNAMIFQNSASDVSASGYYNLAVVGNDIEKIKWKGITKIASCPSNKDLYKKETSVNLKQACYRYSDSSPIIVTEKYDNHVPIQPAEAEDDYLSFMRIGVIKNNVYNNLFPLQDASIAINYGDGPDGPDATPIAFMEFENNSWIIFDYFYGPFVGYLVIKVNLNSPNISPTIQKHLLFSG